MERTKTLDRVKSGLMETTGHGAAEIIRHMAAVDVNRLDSWEWDVTEKSHKVSP